MVNSEALRLAARIKLRHMQIAVALRDAPSAREVAARFHVSESAVSKTLAELDHLLGFRLFERSGNARRTSEQGQAVLAAMEALVMRVHTMAQLVGEVREGQRGQIALGVATDQGKMHIAPLLHAFGQAHPDVALDVQAGGFRAMADLLHTEAIDALVCYDDAELGGPGMGRLGLLPPQPLVVLANARLSPLAGLGPLDWAALHGQPWCLPRPGTMMHARLGEALRAAGLEFPARGIQVSDLLMIDAFLRATDHLVLLPEGAARRLVAVAGAVVLPLEVGLASPPTLLVWRGGAELRPVLRSFLGYCREHAADGSPAAPYDRWLPTDPPTQP